MASQTKLDLVIAALSMIGVAVEGTQLTAKELADSCAVLDDMMASWDAKGIHLGYPITSTIPVDLTTQTNVPAEALRAVKLNLALELADLFGRVLPPTSRISANAKDALTTLQGLMVTPPPLGNRSGIPAGAGSWRGRAGRGWWSPFLPATETGVTVGDDSELE